MRKSDWLAVAALAMASALSACGGGGSGGDSATGVTGGAGADGGSWLTFEPPSISKTVTERNFTTPFSLVAKSSKLIGETINVAIIDEVGITDPTKNTVVIRSATEYVATFFMAPNLAAGEYKGSIKVRICLDDPHVCSKPYPGSPWVVPVDVKVQPWAVKRTVRKLLMSDVGVALTNTPDFSRLTKSITVSDNLGAAGRWLAKSDQPWLKVSGSGGVGDPVQIVAEPQALRDDTIHYATVSVTSADPSVAAAEPVVVALWKGSARAQQRVSSVNSDFGYDQLVSDPIRPYVYASKSGVIDVYNVYSGVRVASLTTESAGTTNMRVSPDGDYLYVISRPVTNIEVFDLKSNRRVQSWPILYNPRYPYDDNVDLIYVRPNGVGVIVLTTGQAFRASDGKVLADFMTLAPPFQVVPQTDYQLQSSYIAASPDGTRIYATGNRQSSWFPFYWDIDYSEFDGGTLSATRGYQSSNILAAPAGIAMSPDGKRVLMVSGYDKVTMWNPSDLSLDRTLFNGQSGSDSGFRIGTLIVTADNRIVVITDDYDRRKFFVLSEAGALLQTLSTQIRLPLSSTRTDEISGLAAGLAVSSDARIVVQRALQSIYNGASWDIKQTLTFSPLPP